MSLQKYVEDFSKVKLTVAEFQKLLSFFVASSTHQQQRIVQIFRTSFYMILKQEVGFPKLKLLES